MGDEGLTAEVNSAVSGSESWKKLIVLFAERCLALGGEQ